MEMNEIKGENTGMEGIIGKAGNHVTFKSILMILVVILMVSGAVGVTDAVVITVGSQPSTGTAWGNNSSTNRTYVNVTAGTGANDTGTLDNIEIYITGCGAGDNFYIYTISTGFVYNDVLTLACNDFTVPGYNQLTAGVTPGFPAGGLAVTQNDWIGFYGVTLTVDRDGTGTGSYSYSNTSPTIPASGGSHVEQNTNTRVMGIYGTGNTPPAGDTLTASGNTNLTTANPDEGTTGYDMQRFQVACSADDDNNCYLSSLDLQDDGNADSLTAYVYISTVNQSTLPGGAVLLGQTSGWNGNPTTIGTFSDAARQVTNGTPKYVYIVYDIPAGQGNNTIQSNVTALSVDSPDSVSGGNVGENTQRNVVSCETATVNVVDPGGPITGPTTINVTLGGTGGSNPEWSTDQATWYASGTQYTPPTCSSGAVTFYGRATGSCSTVTDPTPVNQTYDTLETKTVTLSVASPINDSTSITAGGTASNLEVRWNEDGGGWSGWVASGSTYTPSCGSGTVDFEAQGVGDCGTVTASDTGNSYSYSDPTTSIITIPASQMFNGDPYNVSSSYTIVQGNVGSIEFKVTTGSGPGAPFSDELEYFDTSDVNNDYTFWTNDAGNPGTNGYLMTRTTGTTTNTCAGGVSSTSYTPSADTGPCELDSGTGFLFLENSGSPAYPDRTFTRSASFDATTYQANISFNYNLNTTSTEGAALLFEVNDGGGWTTEWEQVDNDGNGGAWTSVDLDLFNGQVSIGGGAYEATSTYGGSDTTYTSGSLQYRFVFVSGSTWANDVALDTIRVYGDAQASETICTNWTSNPNIPASGTPCDPYLETTDNYNLYVRGTDPDCGDPVTASPDPQQFTWNSCSNFDTLDLVVADNLTVPTAITATYTGSPTNIEVRWDDGSGWSTWQPNGSTFTPADVCIAGTVNFEARGDDSNCGQYALSASDYGNNYQIMDDVAVLTITSPASASSIWVSQVVQVEVTGESTPATMTNMSLTTANTSACDLTDDQTGWSWSGTHWEKTWDISACGSPDEPNVTIDVSGADPDCPVPAKTATQVNNITVTTGPVYTITSCSGCHNMPPADSTGGRGTPPKSVVGSHGVAEHLAATCTHCHIDNGTPASAYPQGLAHREGLIEIITNIHGQIGASYSKGTSFAQTDTPTLGTCSNTFCHGTVSPTWGTDLSGTSQCKRCHGDTGNPNDAPPVDTAGNTGTVSSNVSDDVQVGAHQAHLQSLNDYSSDITCDECHAVPSAVGDAGHIDSALPAEMTWGDLATHNSGVYAGGQDLTPTYAGSGGVCSNYCHGGNTFPADGSPSTQTDPDWNTSLFSGTGGSDCGQCHGNPPNTGSHGGVSANVCSGCHLHVNDSATSAPFFNDLPLHINGVLDGGGDCITCHDTGGAGTTGPNNRDAIVTEFGLAWGHKKSGRGTVTVADCIVCHLEGNSATQSPSSYHADGNIDLRDPDGAGETPITDYASNPFTFTEFSISFNAGDRASAISTNSGDPQYIADTLTQKFCIACHDGDGATNPTARTTGGTAEMPFGGIDLGANYTVTNGAVAAGGLVNVSDQFATTNSGYHPVRGPLNRDFPTADRVANPYKPTGTRGTSGTLSDSVIMNCFDCHTDSTATTTRTIVSHGNAETIRGTIYVQDATLCLECHIGAYSTSNNHATGSAWGSTGSSHSTVRRNCYWCHGGGTNSYPSRPIAAQDYHGNNALVGGGTWPASGTRPYAFIRAWSGNAWHRPYRSSEFSTGSAQCNWNQSGGGGGCPNGQDIGDASNRTYTPGGSY